MSKTLVFNTSEGAFTMPPPYTGTIPPGQFGCANDTKANVEAALGLALGVNVRCQDAANSEPTTLPLATSASVPDGSIGLADLASAVVVQILGTPGLTAGAENEGAETVTVTVQMKDAQGNALAASIGCDVWISDTAGAVPSSGAPSGGTVIGGSGIVLKIVTADVLFRVISKSDGTFTVTLTESTATTFYVNVACGGHVASVAAVFTA